MPYQNTHEKNDAVFQQGFLYAKAGVMLFNLAERDGQQGNLLDIAAPDEQKGKDKKLMSALDAVNKRYGRGAVRYGAEGGADAPWQMKHSRRSPKYNCLLSASNKHLKT